MVCPCTLFGVCVVCPGTSELVGQQIKGAKENDIKHLNNISFLAMAIKASTAYTPKHRQEQALIAYTKDVIARGIQPNDHDISQQRAGGNAFSLAAYHGYENLLKLLLTAGCGGC